MKQKFIPYIYILFSILVFNQSYGQKKVLKISTIDSTSLFLIKDVQYQKIHFTENTISKTLDSVKLQIERKGFVNYSLDSLVKNDSLFIAYFNLRNQVRKIRVHYDRNEIDPEVISAKKRKTPLGYFEVKPNNLPYKLQTISNALENDGNSFSEVVLKNLSVMNDTLIKADLFIKKSTVRKIDKIKHARYWL